MPLAFAFACAALLLFLALATSGCAGAADAGAVTEADTAPPPPLLSFGADWTVTQSAPLVAGRAAILHFDFARLPRCRASASSVPAWNTYAGMNADGGRELDVVLTRAAGPTLTPVDATFTVPFGRDLAIWFHNSDDSGCSDWDSRFGADYHFAIQPADAPVIHFRRDWSVAVDGVLRAGADVIIDYEIVRLPNCRQTYNGLQTWDVLVEPADVSVTMPTADGWRQGAPARLRIPSRASTFVVWFENTDRTGCRAYDSDYGRNFSFHL